MLDKNEIARLLKKTDLIKYCYADMTIWNATYVADDIDRKIECDYITEGNYNLKTKVYLYKDIRNRLKLFAVISEKGIKYCETF